MNIKEIKFIFQNVPTKRTLALDDFTDKFYQILQKIIPILHKHFQKEKRMNNP